MSIVSRIQIDVVVVYNVDLFLVLNSLLCLSLSVQILTQQFSFYIWQCDLSHFIWHWLNTVDIRNDSTSWHWHYRNDDIWYDVLWNNTYPLPLGKCFSDDRSQKARSSWYLINWCIHTCTLNQEWGCLQGYYYYLWQKVTCDLVHVPMSVYRICTWWSCWEPCLLTSPLAPLLETTYCQV